MMYEVLPRRRDLGGDNFPSPEFPGSYIKYCVPAPQIPGEYGVLLTRDG